LEGKSPALRVFVIDFEQVNILVRTNVLPVAEGLVKDEKLREVFSNYFQNCRFPTAYVSFYGDEEGPV
jgi:hypothetical protein